MEKKLISSKEIDKAFENTNFGGSTPEKIIKDTLTKVAQGYATGHTAECIALELGLIHKVECNNNNLYLTENGCYYIAQHGFKIPLI